MGVWQVRERLVIEGGVPLSGTVVTSAAKNAVLPLMAAAILTHEECILREVPKLRDVEVMSQILCSLGADVESIPDQKGRGLALSIRPADLNTHICPEALMGEMRSSIFLMGALLGRLGMADVAYPGGCSIGPRPIDLHLFGLRSLGADVQERYGRIEARAPVLSGCEVHLELPSVGATENVILAATLARGTTVIRNPAKEPEIQDLQRFLNAMGARIKGAGHDPIVIEGVRKLHGAAYTPIPDRIEAGTLMLAAAITAGTVDVTNVIPKHHSALLSKLRQSGMDVTVRPSSVNIRAQRRPLSVDCRTLPYPGFPTDLQPPVMSLLAVADGTSVITETIYERRFNHSEELCKMGANIHIEGRSAIIKGVERLYGAKVRVHDLRAGASLVLAGLAAEGTTLVEDICHIDRGYDGLERKLSGLGAKI
ncbi:MAG: UDP-N-acetylglucosamine 1-carboxyvinyltransferase, partial [Firmicutes bacterium RBG_13_65_8]